MTATTISSAVQIEPLSVEFGRLAVGDEGSSILTVTHTSTVSVDLEIDASDLHAKGIVLNGEKLNCLTNSPDRYCLSINNHEQIQILCRFSPKKPFEYFCVAMKVFVNGVDDIYAELPISAYELVPEIQITPSSLDLGCLPLNTDRVVELELLTVGFMDPISVDYTFEKRVTPISLDDGRASDGRLSRKLKTLLKEDNNSSHQLSGSDVIRLVFPEGNTIYPYSPLPVELHVLSETAIDIFETLVFYDEQARRYEASNCFKIT